MQVVFVSNYFNHHQLSFCDALYELLEGSFCFLQTQPMEEERVKMGWQAEERPYVRYVQADGTATSGLEWQNLLLTADVVIFGGCDDESYIRERLAAGKPIFRYNERLYKEGQWKAISPRGLLQKYKDHTRYRKAPVYFLCARSLCALRPGDHSCLSGKNAAVRVFPRDQRVCAGGTVFP